MKIIKGGKGTGSRMDRQFEEQGFEAIAQLWPDSLFYLYRKFVEMGWSFQLTLMPDGDYPEGVWDCTIFRLIPAQGEDGKDRLQGVTVGGDGDPAAVVAEACRRWSVEQLNDWQGIDGVEQVVTETPLGVVLQAEGKKKEEQRH